jgi:hypothetical protein
MLAYKIGRILYFYDYLCRSEPYYQSWLILKDVQSSTAFTITIRLNLNNQLHIHNLDITNLTRQQLHILHEQQKASLVRTRPKMGEIKDMN